MRFLNSKMEPGKSYEVKDLIYLLEAEYEGLPNGISRSFLEPHRPRWHRIVTNAVRLSQAESIMKVMTGENLRTKDQQNFRILSK